MDEIPREKLTGALRRGSVKKHVAAIHVSGKLTLLQRKLSNVLLLNAYDTLTQARSFQMDARTLCLMVGYNSNDFETLKASLRGLAETVAEWDMLDEAGQQEWGVSSLLSYAKLKGGVCEYAYSPALAEKLADPKVFALINLNIQRRFTSGHALALYENCYRFHRTGSTGWWPLETFRRLMGVDDSSYYEIYKHLNAKIIKPAVAEVNRASNIVIAPETRKRGRAVTDIRFAIKPNPQLAILDLDDGAGHRRAPVYDRLRAMGVSDRLARQWMTQHGEAQIAGKLDYVDAQSDVKSPARYLAAALRDGYGGAGEGPERPSEALSGPVSARAARLGRVQALVAQRTPTQRDADKRLFLTSLDSAAARADFERHGWMSALNAKAILAFWEDLYPGAFDGVSDGAPQRPG
ncbi:replication initiation protein [Roseobacter sinensis]|uniref:Replication initiation protein n=1 Tax=Roseobacter sinensis TaxID=2931391 RepID=A0ABT3BK66_9RHOB|nr:replication initiation protein [Roseobacter sp. WL0113]MCV3273946.1 replication initiation protein [Roseobacter sp. WL0113]